MNFVVLTLLSNKEFRIYLKVEMTMFADGLSGGGLREK
jgi:hypothetical protein